MASPSADAYIDVGPHLIPEPQPANPPGTQPSDPANPQFRATTTTDQHGGARAPALQSADNRDTDAQRGENYGDSSGRLWMMYLTESEKEDKEITDNWKVDTEGILVFTGLFSATVASFIIESYKQLSPNSSDTTNALLIQISQQLVNISNGTPLTSVAAQSSQPFKPSASAVRVNVMWFLSLVLSLTCALSATLMQQWARRYLQLAQRRGAPHKRARRRAYIFDGIKRFEMTRAIETMPTLLHLSVFLFFAGLIDFLIPINATVAYFTLGWIALFALAYAILTILPNLFLNCPYRTPLSGITWRLSQFSVLGIFLAIRGIEGLFHRHLLSLWRWTHQQATGTLGPTKLREILDNQVAIHRRWLSDGLRKSVELSATDAPSTVDADALEWTITALDEDKEIEDFAARVPGFFESRAVPDPTSAILPLMSDQETTDPILGSRLYDLLRTCIPGTSPLTEEKRKSRMRVCLESLWYCGRAYNQPEHLKPLPSYVRVVFASPAMTYRIQAEEDRAAHVIGRCFGALIAKKFSADVNSRRTPEFRVRDGELASLSAILGTESREVVYLLSQPGAIELANIVSLISADAVLLGDTMPSDVLNVFNQTLRILSQTLLTDEAEVALPPIQVARFHEIYARAPNWLKDELRQISDRLPQNSSYAQEETVETPQAEPAQEETVEFPLAEPAQEEIVAFPQAEPAQEEIVEFPQAEPAQESCTSVSHVSQQSRENEVRIGGAPDSGIGDGLDVS